MQLRGEFQVGVILSAAQLVALVDGFERVVGGQRVDVHGRVPARGCITLCGGARRLREGAVEASPASLAQAEAGDARPVSGAAVEAEAPVDDLAAGTAVTGVADACGRRRDQRVARTRPAQREAFDRPRLPLAKRHEASAAV